MKKIGPLYIAVIYVAISLLWIFFSDRLLFEFRHEFSPETLLTINIGKGFLFVMVTGLSIFFLTFHSNRQIKKSEYEYRNLYENNPSPMWLYKSDSLKFISVNQAAIRFYGYSREEFLKMTLRDIRPKEDYEQVSDAIKREHNHHNSGIWRHSKKDGSIVFVEITSSRIKFVDHDAVMVLASDRTEAIRLEQELLKANQHLVDEKKRLNDAQELSKIAAWQIYIADGRLGLSDEVYKIFNTTPQITAITYGYILKAMHPDDRPLFLNAKDQTVNKGVDLDIVHRLQPYTGNLKYIRQLGKLEYRDGRPYKIRCTMQDITDFKAIEFEKNRIDNENKRLATIVTKINNMVIILDNQSRITWVNKAYEQFTGYSLNEVVGRIPSQFMTGPESTEMVTYINAQEKKRLAFAVEITNYNKAGIKYWAHIEFTPMFDDYGNFSGYITIHNDISARHEKEEEITRQNSLLKNIAWSSSHEIRRPVASILGLMELIKTTNDGAEKDEYIQLLNECTVQLDDIIRKINNSINDDLIETEQSNQHP